MAQQVTG